MMERCHDPIHLIHFYAAVRVQITVLFVGKLYVNLQLCDICNQKLYFTVISGANEAEAELK